jgi:hypothetical protein
MPWGSSTRVNARLKQFWGIAPAAGKRAHYPHDLNRFQALLGRFLCTFSNVYVARWHTSALRKHLRVTVSRLVTLPLR